MSLFHQISLHVAGQGDWPAKAERAETQEVAQEIPQGKRDDCSAIHG